MKKVIVIGILLLSMTGCFNLVFDSTEFNNTLTIRETADTATLACGTSDFNMFLNVLKHNMDHQYDYSLLRAGGKPQIAHAMTDLKSLVDELYNRYQTTPVPSVEYCKIKTANISKGADIIVKELGRL